jgi:hypothetical protein
MDNKNEQVSVSLPQQLEVKHEAEIIVIGGGPGGLGAAITAAREGKDVLLVEHYGFLGGMASNGEVNPFMHNHINNESMDKGVYTEWVERIGFYTGLKDSYVIDPSSARLAAEDLCLEAGVRLLFHHRLAHVETEGNKIAGVVLHSKSGLSVAKADIYIDSTGDGDLAAMAGCPFEMGGETSDAVQPMTMCFKLKLVDEDMPEGCKLSPETPAISFARQNQEIYQQIQEVYQKAKEDGRMECPRENVLMFPGTDFTTVHFNTTRVVFKSSVNGDQLSDAEIEGRKQIRQYFDLLRKEIPIFKHCKLHSIATQIGIRESRRITGHNYLVRKDFNNAAKFEDGIARVNYPIDIHSTTGGGTEITHLPEGDWYEIPYGCIVPKGINNILMACRGISVDHAVHSSMRVMPPVVSIGQAAGIAAVMSLKDHVSPAELDGVEVKKALIERGRNLV